MPKTPKPKTSWEKIYDILASVYEDYWGTDDEWGEAITKIYQELKREKEEALEEAVKLSDEIEAGKETTFEEWKAFKGFRNTLRDRLKEREGK